ncbi:MAG: serine/threonine protein kinase, partial [Cyanobacteriota bacterium]|nr:serine/threonine protein kinase [Cyanobacteriota bacterium]
YGYMSQEQFGGRAVAASDLYSLGATLIYLVTGSHPADLLRDDMVIEFDKSVNLSSDFVHWLKWMTQTTLKKRPNSAELALKELENPTIVESKLVVAKPKGSKVQLTKSKDDLEIFIPPIGCNLTTLIPCPLFMFWFYFVFSQFPNPIKWFAILFGIFIFNVFILNCVFKVFGYIILHINQDKIEVLYKIFGIKFREQPVSHRSDICKLEVVGRTLYNNNEIPPRLIIWAGKRNYELGKIIFPVKVNSSSLEKEYLTPPEIDWLAQELSDFLKLPISSDTVLIKRGWWEKK